MEIPKIVFIVVIISLCSMWFYIGHLQGKNRGTQYAQEQAIEHNCAQYNPTTGDFEWIGEGR